MMRKEERTKRYVLDMNRDWIHLTVAMVVSYDKFGCFYIDMYGHGRKKKG